MNNQDQAHLESFRRLEDIDSWAINEINKLIALAIAMAGIVFMAAVIYFINGAIDATPAEIQQALQNDPSHCVSSEIEQYLAGTTANDPGKPKPLRFMDLRNISNNCARMATQHQALILKG